MRHTGRSWNSAHLALLERFKSAVAPCARGGSAQQRDALAGFAVEMAEMTRTIPRYLAANFNEATKYDCALHHYTWLLDRFAPATLHALLAEGTELWSAEVDGLRYAACLRAEHWVAREGALSIDMLVAGQLIYTLSFSIAPARLLGLRQRDAILVSRVQGQPGQFEGIRAATKALSDVSPRAALFAALCGLAKAVGIAGIAGVTGDNFIYSMPENREALERQYDAFFESLEASGPENGFYLVDVWTEPKPVTAQKAGHRIRTRKKRAFKSQIAAQAEQSFAAAYPFRLANLVAEPAE